MAFTAAYTIRVRYATCVWLVCIAAMLPHGAMHPTSVTSEDGKHALVLLEREFALQMMEGDAVVPLMASGSMGGSSSTRHTVDLRALASGPGERHAVLRVRKNHTKPVHDVALLLGERRVLSPLFSPSVRGNQVTKKQTAYSGAASGRGRVHGPVDEQLEQWMQLQLVTRGKERHDLQLSVYCSASRDGCRAAALLGLQLVDLAHPVSLPGGGDQRWVLLLVEGAESVRAVAPACPPPHAAHARTTHALTHPHTHARMCAATSPQPPDRATTTLQKIGQVQLCNCAEIVAGSCVGGHMGGAIYGQRGQGETAYSSGGGGSGNNAGPDRGQTGVRPTVLLQQHYAAQPEGMLPGAFANYKQSLCKANHERKEQIKEYWVYSTDPAASVVAIAQAQKAADREERGGNWTLEVRGR